MRFRLWGGIIWLLRLQKQDKVFINPILNELPAPYSSFPLQTNPLYIFRKADEVGAVNYLVLT